MIVTHESGPQSLGAALETRLAVNEVESWSGFLGLKAHVERSFPGRWFADQTVTGSHRASLGALVDRTCDVASVDVTVWEHALAERPEELAELRVIDRTVDWPAPPFSLGSQLRPRVRKSLRTALLAARTVGRTAPGRCRAGHFRGLPGCDACPVTWNPSSVSSKRATRTGGDSRTRYGTVAGLIGAEGRAFLPFSIVPIGV